MKNRRVWGCVAATGVLIATASQAKAVTSHTHTDISPQISAPSSLPPPHLGYGINVRSQDKIDPLFTPLGFDWLKLWEEYEDDPPTERLPYNVLFTIECKGMPADLDQWGDHVEAIATAGKGFVEAYEIGNEPNVIGFWGNTPPDPGQYVAVLQEAYARIKAVDPGAIVVSAGLAPVGRIQGSWNGWNGNNGNAMDEREYARQVFLLDAGESFDVFGYHPYGFASPPETDPHSVVNGFAFRGAEVMYGLLELHDLGHKQIWATEFSWLRDPSYDPGHGGLVPGWCHSESTFNTYFEWMDVPEVTQANYLTRAFQYADEHWPWMGAMFVWNLDWYDYNWLCEPSRYFSIRKDDGTALGAPALAYDALIAMEKRPGKFGQPRLTIEPTTLTFLADVNEPGILTGTLTPLNTGSHVLTWTATIAQGMQVTPTLVTTTGLQGTPLRITVDSTGYATGTFSGVITVTATMTDVLDVPQTVPVTLLVVPEIHRVYLPVTLRAAP
jgi:hypothetical protein